MTEVEGGVEAEEPGFGRCILKSSRITTDVVSERILLWGVFIGDKVRTCLAHSGFSINSV